MKQIRLSSGDFALVDDDLFDVLSSYHWSLSGGEDNNRYAYTTGGKYMHRLVIGAAKGQYVDHINRNSLDNRLENLRICTNTENLRNANKRKNAKSTFKGVCPIKNRPAWRALIKINGKQQYLGYFKSEVEAALAYNEAAKRYFGEFAVLNQV